MQARRFVAAPEAQSTPFGLLSVATVVPDDDPHLALAVSYETLACSTAHLTSDQCVTDAAQQESFVSDDGKDVVDGDAFVVYALHTCRLLGGYETAEADARTRLDTGFGRAVEEGLEAASLGAADDLTPTVGTAVHPLAALAILEKYARANYGKVPVFHATPDVATVLAGAGVVDRYGPRLETKLGAPVAVGGGYGTALDVGVTTAVAGESWLRVTGTVVIRRSVVRVFGPTIGAASPTNELKVFATQPVVVTTECINAAVLVKSVTALGLDGGAP